MKSVDCRFYAEMRKTVTNSMNEFFVTRAIIGRAWISVVTRVLL